MDALYIEKSTLLSGKIISIAGYRHASNLALSASLILPNTTFNIKNIPDVVDTDVMLNLLTNIGATASTRSNSVNINTSSVEPSCSLDYELCEKIHGSIYLLPALLARFGKVTFGKSGGCQIGSSEDNGSRPVSHITDVMMAFGANVIFEKDNIVASADQLKATTIDISKFSYEKDRISGPLTSGATKTAILLALAVKNGKTIIKNPFLKSEAIDLLSLVKSIGFKVTYNKRSIEIERSSVNSIVNHNIISDPSEIITYMCLAVYHRISLTLTDITMHQTKNILQPELDQLKNMGVNYKITDTHIIVLKNHDILPSTIDITPTGVCTDHHPFLLLIQLLANGQSTITEHVWHERFHYIPEMKKFSINLIRKMNTVYVNPQTPSHALDVVHGLDLRAAAMLLIVALKAPGVTQMTHFSHLYRGYEYLFPKLEVLGAVIKKNNVMINNEVINA